MTPQELHTALADRRKEKNWPWWRVAVRLDISERSLEQMQKGVLSTRLRERAEAWLGEAS